MSHDPTVTLSDPEAPPATAAPAAEEVKVRPAVRLLSPYRRGRGESTVRYLLDSRLFRLLRAPGREKMLENFQASLVHHGIAPEGSLPALELTPMGFLAGLGVDPPAFDPFILPPSVLKSGEHSMAAAVLVKLAGEKFRGAPAIRPEQLEKRIEELKQKSDPAAHELIDLCTARLLATGGFTEQIYNQLSLDYLYKFPFPEVLREEMFEFLCASLVAAGETVAGLSKMRSVKMIWDRAYEQLLRGNPGARGEIQALDREMRLWNRKDFLEWEMIHHAILGQGSLNDRIHPVTAFTLASPEKLKARAIAYKTALRSFLDQIGHDDLVKMRSQFEAWKPGLLVPCQEDGTFEAPVPTGDLPVYIGRAAAQEDRK
jgi:hypothetical protein